MQYFSIRRADARHLPLRGAPRTAPRYACLLAVYEQAQRLFSDALSRSAPEFSAYARVCAEDLRDVGRDLRDTDPWAHRRPVLSFVSLPTSES